MLCVYKGTNSIKDSADYVITYLLRVLICSGKVRKGRAHLVILSTKRAIGHP
jgi:hypothetical protein